MAGILDLNNLLRTGALSQEVLDILSGKTPVPARNPKDPRIDQKLMSSNAPPPAIAQAMAPAAPAAPTWQGGALSQVPTAGASYDMPDVAQEVALANQQAAEAPMAQAMAQAEAKSPGILESLGLKSDNLGKRIANALMAAGSQDPGKTLAALQSQDEEIRKARSEASKPKITPIQGGAFSLIQNPDGTYQYVKNEDVAKFVDDVSGRKLMEKILLSGVNAQNQVTAANQKAAGAEQVKTAGDSAATALNVAELTRIQEALGKTDTASGPIVGNLPKFLRDTFFPEGTSLQDSAERIIQASLRQTLGAQFTEKEGARFLERAYNPRLSEAENARRLGVIIEELKTIQGNKDAALEYMKKNGTLEGFNAQSNVPAAPAPATTSGATQAPGTTSRFKASSKYF